MKKKIMNFLNLDYIFFNMNLMIIYMYCINKINVLFILIYLYILIKYKNQDYFCNNDGKNIYIYIVKYFGFFCMLIYVLLQGEDKNRLCMLFDFILF